MAASTDVSDHASDPDSVELVNTMYVANIMDEDTVGSGAVKTPEITIDGPSIRQACITHQPKEDLPDTTATNVDIFAGLNIVDKAAPSDMKLAPKQPVQILAEKRVEVAPGVFVWSDTPFFIEVHKPAVIKGVEVLNEKFGKGWSKLPDELKVKILSFDPELNDDIRPRGKEHCFGHQNGWKTLKRYHEMAPEFGILATQIFYKTHHFHITGVCTPSDSSSFRPMFFPKPNVNRWIKVITLCIPLHIRAWTWLEKLASGSLGFQDLQYLAVEVFQTVDFVALGSTLVDVPLRMQVCNEPFVDKFIVFKCKGKVIYTCDAGYDDFYVDISTKKDTLVCEMEELLLRRITFGSGS
ncbi:uncharacterized protein N0V89_001256 [Didymosphaeria variabile]|uniref:Uncharacterized protein n=1 Tax=Didymosphaeria variabile TaxID=1932322 RepID=A0A9W8XYZ5_9PLEO|nr:uncharacterized protein N0V89_001256 [Didymosphaeria variabile]KAJ4360689.1 hypothetical protein N0V89_001256 [Didymosphaeria variabile]